MSILIGIVCAVMTGIGIQRTPSASEYFVRLGKVAL